jgi:hypothetical protein
VERMQVKEENMETGARGHMGPKKTCLMTGPKVILVLPSKLTVNEAKTFKGRRETFPFFFRFWQEITVI